MILPIEPVPGPAVEVPAKKKRRKPKGASPTARSLDLLRSRGYVADVVERWIPRCFIKKDLFGFIDILAIRRGETLAVQATDGTNVSHRIAKIAEAPLVGAVREAGWTIHVHGWRKLASTGKWECREEDVS